MEPSPREATQESQEAEGGRERWAGVKCGFRGRELVRPGKHAAEDRPVWE